ATRGRLSIVHWLHYTRNEGCSAIVFTGATTNDHLDTLQWFILHYREHYRPEHCLLCAAENGCITVRYLHPQIPLPNVEATLEAAAAMGQIRSLEPLVPGPYNISRAFIFAATNGHVGALRFFIDRGYYGYIVNTNVRSQSFLAAHVQHQFSYNCMSSVTIAPLLIDLVLLQNRAHYRYQRCYRLEATA
ncbi:hypothetical protein PHMEG_00037126, partial [Phytophthora megakarya]